MAEGTLKTLKELHIRKTFYNGDEVQVEELRQEVIKWLKTANRQPDFSTYNEVFTGLSSQHINGIKMFIKHFFNITEKELK